MKAAALHDAWRSLPITTPAALLPGTTLLLAPHPDDESLGCGGLIAALCDAGRPPLLVVLTDGAASHPNSVVWPAARRVAQRRAETLRAASRLGLAADRVRFASLPDTASPHAGPALARVVASLSDMLDVAPCDQILTSWAHDPHCDHESAWRIGQALSACTRLTLLAYPVWGWLIPPDVEIACAAPAGWRLDISSWTGAKRRAIAAHESQYGGLIDDDPTGFVLPPALLSMFETGFETVLSA